MEDATCAEEKFCRICYLEDELGDLCSPCRCLGSVRFVHTKCLIRWLKIPNGSCELCGHRYTIQKSIKPYYKRTSPCVEKCKILKIITTIMLMDWIHFGEMIFLFCSLCALNSLRSVDLLYQVGLIVVMELFYYAVQFISCVMFMYYQEWCQLNMNWVVLNYDPGRVDCHDDMTAGGNVPWVQWAAERYIQLVTRTQYIMEVIESVNS